MREIQELDARRLHLATHDVIRRDEELVREADDAGTDAHEDPVAFGVLDRLADFRLSQDNLDLDFRDFRHVGLGFGGRFDRFDDGLGHGGFDRRHRDVLGFHVVQTEHQAEGLHVLDRVHGEKRRELIDAVFTDECQVAGAIVDHEPLGIDVKLGAQLEQLGAECLADRSRRGLLLAKGLGPGELGDGLVDGEDDGGVGLLAHEELLLWGLYPYLLRTFCLRTPEVGCARGLA